MTRKQRKELFNVLITNLNEWEQNNGLTSGCAYTHKPTDVKLIATHTGAKSFFFNGQEIGFSHRQTRRICDFVANINPISEESTEELFNKIKSYGK